MVDTRTNTPISNELVHSYFKSLVNSFFKVLPMYENGESSLPTYLDSLQSELLGCGSFIPALAEESQFLTLIAILQYMIDNPEEPVKKVRREVFKAISICNRLKTKYIEASSNDSVVSL